MASSSKKLGAVEDLWRRKQVTWDGWRYYNKGQVKDLVGSLHRRYTETVKNVYHAVAGEEITIPKGCPKEPEGQEEGQKDKVTTANQWTVRFSLQGTVNNNRRTQGIVTWLQREYGKVVGEVSVSTY